METQNLWPDFVIEPIKSPKVILKEQAGYFMAKTNNILSAEIETSHYQGSVTHNFIVVAPAMNNYRYGIFSVKHKVVGYYPLSVSWNDDNEPSWIYKEEAKNEKDFIELLRTIFNKSEITRTVSSLLAQSLAE